MRSRILFIAKLLIIPAAIATLWLAQQLANGAIGGPTVDQRMVFAAGNHDPAGMNQALQDGAAVDARDAQQMTALMWAASSGNVTTARRLIERGADVNATDHLRQTPLMFAARFNHAAMIKLLITSGADPVRQDYRGRTALDDAMTFEARDAIALLHLPVNPVP